jgi:hypothetical protein
MSTRTFADALENARAQVSNYTTARNKSCIKCDRCTGLPATITYLTGMFQSPLTSFAALCPACNAAVQDQLRSVIRLIATRSEAHVYDAMTSGSKIPTAVKTVWDACATASTSGPSVEQKAYVDELSLRVLKCRVMHCERSKYDSLRDFNRAMANPVDSTSPCFCCEKVVAATDPVYSVAGRWLMCVRCRDALIPVPSSL